MIFVTFGSITKVFFGSTTSLVNFGSMMIFVTFGSMTNFVTLGSMTTSCCVAAVGISLPLRPAMPLTQVAGTFTHSIAVGTENGHAGPNIRKRQAVTPEAVERKRGPRSS